MADDAHAARAERRAENDLFFPGRGTGEQEVGDVRACDQQDEADGAEKDQERGPDLADELLTEGEDLGRAAPVVLRVLGRALGRDGLHLGPGRVERRAGFQARHHGEEAAELSGLALRGHRENRPDFRGPARARLRADVPLETLRKHADHGKR